jgi:hypothetical protein
LGWEIGRNVEFIERWPGGDARAHAQRSIRREAACGASERVIARSVGIGRTAIGEYIRRAAVIG